jgi:hypothetical protein
MPNFTRIGPPIRLQWRRALSDVSAETSPMRPHIRMRHLLDISTTSVGHLGYIRWISRLHLLDIPATRPSYAPGVGLAIE